MTLTHQQFLRMVWGSDQAHDIQWLRVYIGHLRQKLGDAAGKLIRTETGIGNRPLERKPAPATPSEDN